ncbi:MAG: transcriptional regulator NrdR [Chloroflexota bacterium]|nr:transcriptional regulator NrdR [Chloroflexota bacterium]MDE2969688.1 transcriptional regulator NrdR [Chloroflexota bacterium]
MRCPYCDHDNSRVTDSRDASDGIKRRRECARCGLRFTTVERVFTGAQLVVKRDGRREEFDREKVRQGVLTACAKRPVSSQAIDRMVDDMERQISALAKAEVPASLVGRMVMEGLKSLDHVAYVRFASVYRNFADLESFAQEVEALQRDPEPNLDAALEAQLSLPITGAETPEKGVRRPKKPAAGG